MPELRTAGDEARVEQRAPPPSAAVDIRRRSRGPDSRRARPMRSQLQLRDRYAGPRARGGAADPRRSREAEEAVQDAAIWQVWSGHACATFQRAAASAPGCSDRAAARLDPRAPARHRRRTRAAQSCCATSAATRLARRAHEPRRRCQAEQRERSSSRSTTGSRTTDRGAAPGDRHGEGRIRRGAPGIALGALGARRRS